MYRCNVKIDQDREIHDVLPPLLLENDGAICALFEAIASCLGMEAETGAIGVRSATTTWYFQPTHTIGWLVYNACPNEGWFEIDIACEKPVDEQHILHVVEKDFVRRTTVGRSFTLAKG